MKKEICFFLLFLLTVVSTHIKAQNISGIINSYYKVLAIDVPTNRAKLNSIAGLTNNDRVIIIQMKGAAVSSSNNSSFGNITSVNNTGLYEFATICGLYHDTVLFKTNLINTYDANTYLQLVKVPQYTNVTITDTLKAQTWDATTGTGGVLALEASGTVTLNSGISASGKGFGGGTFNNYGANCSFFGSPYYYNGFLSNDNNSAGNKGEGITNYILGKEYGKGKLANGGGGGNNHNAGGAGGANYGSGGSGGSQTGLFCDGSNPGIGGIALNSYGYTSGINRIFLGGGGGAGHMNNNEGVRGGNGGGIIIIRCNTLDGSNHSIEASGMQPFNQNNSPSIYEANGDGGGGGGGGGLVIIDAATISNNLALEAKGGNGNNSGFQTQCTGPGGGGGGGVIWLSSSSVPVNVTTNITGGANGVVKVAACFNNPNGATSGSNGAILTNYVKPEGTNITCDILAENDPIKFNGEVKGDYVQLKWIYNNPSALSKIYLQKFFTATGFQNLQLFTDFTKPEEQFADKLTDKKQLYRLLIIQTDGHILYSPVLSFTAASVNLVKIFPNPAKEKLTILFNSIQSYSLLYTITDVTGKVCMENKQVVSRGSHVITANLSGIPAGVYFVRLNFGDDILVRKINIQ